MRKKLVRFFDYLNPALLLSPIIPLVYQFGFADDIKIGYELFAESLLIIIPIMLIAYLANRCKHFIMFIAGSVLVVTVMSFLLYFLCVILTGNRVMMGAVFIFDLEIVAFIMHHFRVRLTFAEQLEDEGRITKQIAHNSIFTRPSLYSFLLLGAYYILAMGFGSKEVCNEIYICAVIYIFMYVINEFIVQTDNYMELHKDVAGIPKKRVYGIGAGMTGVMLIMVFLMILPSVAFISSRPYYDLRNILNYSEERTYEQEIPQFQPEKREVDNSLGELLDNQEVYEWPAWAKALSQILIMGLLFVIILMILKEVINTLKRFETSFDENGDIIENLADDPDEDIISTGFAIDNNNPQIKRIRKQYKKAIRKARKENPMPYETPTEMEELAGIKDEEWMQKLHREYESARYNKV